MTNIVNGKPVDFIGYKFDANGIKTALENYSFKNGRPITRSMLTWWALNRAGQPLPSIETSFEIEHIFQEIGIELMPH